MTRPGTFSIVAARGGLVGVAVATRLPGVGGLCSWTREGVAVATQAWTNPYLAARLLEAVAGGEAAPDALAAVMADEVEGDQRQVAVVDGAGRAAAWTGDCCDPHAGHLIGEGYSVQGNMLGGPDVLAAMAAAFEAGPDPAGGLLAALAAGERLGGDHRGHRSAALRLHGTEWYPDVDLRVDEHPDPVAELHRVLEVARRELFPFVRALPTRADPRGRFDDVRDEVRSMR
jgi:uncharacterized Ntn-hydrolase superfamily protein